MRRGRPRSPRIDALQAAAHEYSHEEPDRRRTATLCGLLAARAPSPVVELNRAVAVSTVEGPRQGLATVDTRAVEPGHAGHHLLPRVCGDLLARLGRTAQAREEFVRAAGLARNERVRQLLLGRAAGCETQPSSPETPFPCVSVGSTVTQPLYGACVRDPWGSTT
ncbi:hypothetical protein ACFW1F_26095 [Streptomyces bungoensis]|uniref:hypothetical protein n=1 Tax=Streptomyces bungoensis TaxID=285568 RepID=UPI0036CD85C9